VRFASAAVPMVVSLVTDIAPSGLQILYYIISVESESKLLDTRGLGS